MTKAKDFVKEHGPHNLVDRTLILPLNDIERDDMIRPHLVDCINFGRGNWSAVHYATGFEWGFDEEDLDNDIAVVLEPEEAKTLKTLISFDGTDFVNHRMERALRVLEESET